MAARRNDVELHQEPHQRCPVEPRQRQKLDLPAPIRVADHAGRHRRLSAPAAEHSGGRRHPRLISLLRARHSHGRKQSALPLACRYPQGAACAPLSGRRSASRYRNGLTSVQQRCFRSRHPRGNSYNTGARRGVDGCRKYRFCHVVSPSFQRRFRSRTEARSRSRSSRDAMPPPRPG